jgi:hypothetical protein
MLYTNVIVTTETFYLFIYCRPYYCVDLVTEYWHMAVAYKMPLQNYSNVTQLILS